MKLKKTMKQLIDKLKEMTYQFNMSQLLGQYHRTGADLHDVRLK